MEKIKEEKFKILNYNILAPGLVKDSLQIDDEEIKNRPYLDTDYRYGKIFDLINKLQPDICLFEEYEEDGEFKALFEKNKIPHEILFKKRPGMHDEGCAISYNKEKFEMEYFCPLELRTFEQQSYTSYKKFNKNIYDKENVAALLLLKSKQTSLYYLFICCHLLFNSGRGDIKLGQIYQIIQSALLIKSYYKDINITTILAGDFNSSPNSAIYEYITQKSLDVEFLDRTKLSGQTGYEYKSGISLKDINNYWYQQIISTFPEFVEDDIYLVKKNKKRSEESKEQGNKMILENKMPMKSFYKEKNGKEPEITSYSLSFQGTFDFIFYNSIYNININYTMDVPTLPYRIPDENNPSDHSPLFVEFTVTY